MVWLTLFLRYYWKHLLVAGLLVTVVTAIYLKGRADYISSQNKAALKELQKRYEDLEKERERLDNITRQIGESRRLKPIDDARDSCLLSNDPYKKKCI